MGSYRASRHQSQPRNYGRPVRDKSEELRAREIRCLSLTRSKSINRQFQRRVANADNKNLTPEQIQEIEKWQRLQREYNQYQNDLSELRQEKDHLIRHQRLAKANEK